MRNEIKRWISMFLVAILVLTSLSTNVYAASGKAAEGIAFETAEPAVKKLSASRLEELSGSKAVYFGTAEAQLAEGEAYYSIPVYREGNLEEEASVSLLTLDISASYGKDYELCSEDVYVAEAQEPLLQRNESSSLMSDEEIKEQAEKLNAIYEKGLSDASDAGHNTEETAEPTGSASENEDGTGRQEENEETAGSEENPDGYGEVTSSILGSLKLNTDTEITDEQLAAALQSAKLDYSAGLVLHFAKGEDEKEIVFHVMEDDLEEGQEMFEFILADAENTVIRNQYTFAAVIDDNEELHDSLISFDAQSYTEEAGQVTVTVNRTTSTYAMIEFELRSAYDTAVPGVNYTEFNQTLTMKPYQTSISHTFEVRGTGRMEVVLVAGENCVVEGSETAEVLIDVEESEEELEELRNKQKQLDALAGAGGIDDEAVKWQSAQLTEDGEIVANLGESSPKEFKIDINGTEYWVQPEVNGGKTVVKGAIYDNSKKIKQRVGDYYFVTRDDYQYGMFEGYDTNSKESHFTGADKIKDSYGELYWYNWKTWNTGASMFRSKYRIPSTYYRYIVPDWEGKHWFGYYQCYAIEAMAAGNIRRSLDFGWRSHGGEFSRRIDTRVQIDIPNKWQNQGIALKLRVEDNGGNSTPKNRIYVYGFACMYKAFDVHANAPATMEFLTKGRGSKTVSAAALSFSIKGGIELPTMKDAIRIYTNSIDGTSEGKALCTAQFTVGEGKLYKQEGKYGLVTGYKMQYGTEGELLDYPAAFQTYLRSRISSSSGETAVDYTKEAVEGRIKLSDTLENIIFDSYMVDWLQSIGRARDGEDASFGSNALPLYFTPNVSYKNVKVFVQQAEGNARFTAQEINKVNYPGEESGAYIYHCGDILDLSAVCDENWQVNGYEYLVSDKTKWQPIYDSSELFLHPEWDTVYIRPLVSRQENRIKIEYYGDAEKHVQVQNLIPQEKLKGTSYAGENLLMINPEAKKLEEMCNPAVGYTYQISMIVTDTPSEEGYIYQPYVLYEANKTKDKAKAKKILCQMYPHRAGEAPKDNVITIGVRKVKASELKTYNIEGIVRMKAKSLWETGFAKENQPVIGYNVVFAGGQETIEDPTTKKKETFVSFTNASTNDKGIYRLNNIKGMQGDLVPVLISSGSADNQVFFAGLKDQTEVSLGNQDVEYPLNSPKPYSINWKYGDPENNNVSDLTSSSVKILDDELILTLKVSEKGRRIKKAVFRVVSIDGSSKPYEVERPAGDDSAVLELKIPKMTENLRNGDRLYVHLVDAQQIVITDGTTQKKVDQTYPVVDTGLRFYVQNSDKVQQWYDSSLDSKMKLDIPLVGENSASPGASSGVMDFEIVHDSQGNGHSLVLNIGIAGNTLTPAMKEMAVNDFSTQLNTNRKIMYEAEKDALIKKVAEGTMYQTAKQSFDRIDKIESKLTSINQQLDKNEKSMEKLLGGMNDPSMQEPFVFAAADISVSIVLRFSNQFGTTRYTGGSVVFGFTALADVTIYKTIKCVPMYINWGVVSQISYTGEFIPESLKTAVTSKTFNTTPGNINQLISSKSGTSTGTFGWGATGYLKPGVGLCGVLGANGAVSLESQVAIVTPKLKYPKDASEEEKKAIDLYNEDGTYLRAAGGIEVSLLLTTLKITIAAVEHTSGKFGEGTKLTWFGSHTNNEQEQLYGSAPGEPEREEKVLSVDGNETTSMVEKLPGSADMSGFGQGSGLLGAAPVTTASPYVDPVVLFENAADDPSIQIVETNTDGSLFMVFLGNRGKSEGEEADPNLQALYYTSYNAELDKWKLPQLLDYDGTADTAPGIQVAGDTINVTWSSAEEEIKSSWNFLERFRRLRIKTATFKVENDDVVMTAGPVYLSGKLASDSIRRKEESSSSASAYYDCLGSTSTFENKIYSLFLRMDLKKATKDEDLQDLTKTPVSLMFAQYDIDTGVLETLESISPVEEDQAILENAEITYVEVKGDPVTASEDKAFLVVSYIQNSEGKLEKEEKNDLMISLIELRPDGEPPVVYPPIPIEDSVGDGEYSHMEIPVYGEEEVTYKDISNDPDQDGVEGLSLSTARITEANGTHYLTWLKEGYIFETIDIGAYVEEMFTEDYLANMYRERALWENGTNTFEAQRSVRDTDNTEGDETEEAESVLKAASALRAGTVSWYEITLQDILDAWEKEFPQEECPWSTEENYYRELLAAEAEGSETEEDPESTPRLFEDSTLQCIGSGELTSLETILGGSDSERLGTGEYQIVGDGSDLYIVYVDSPGDYMGLAQELYAIKLNFVDAAAGDDTAAESDPDSDIYYSAPVQLTNAGHVLRSFKAIMAGGQITTISSCVDQWIPEEGGIKTGTNSIVAVQYTPTAITGINENTLAYNLSFEDTNYINLSYQVEGRGLEPQLGYKTRIEWNGDVVFEEDRTKVTENSYAVSVSETAGEETDPAAVENETTVPRLLRSGKEDSYEVHVPFTTLNSTETFTFYVTDPDGNMLDSAELSVEAEEKLTVTDVKVQKAEEGLEALVTVKNEGACSSEARGLTVKIGDELSIDNEIEKAGRTLKSETVPVLQPGGTKEYVIPLMVQTEDFNDLCLLNVEAILEGEKAGRIGRYAPELEEAAVIEDGKEVLTLTKGISRSIKAEAVPYPEGTGEVLYYSADSSVASVSKDGILTANKYGETTISIYLADWGLSDSITVKVQEKGNDDEPTNDSGTSAGRLPSYVDQGGSWKQDANGNWTYTTKAGALAKDKWLAIASSTFGKGGGFEWFRFDKDGNMVTGWFRDSDDRMYYLQIVSDGYKGRMLTGWQYIGGNWYYFEPESNGYRGAMYVNTKTRDGYTVGQNGVWDGKEAVPGQ